jgi:transposase
MHAGGRSAKAIDAGRVPGESTGALVRDGCAGCQRLQAVRAWRGARLPRGLRPVSGADPGGQVWAAAMANTLLEANRAARQAREQGADRLEEAALKQTRDHCLGALAQGEATTRAITASSPPRPAPSSRGPGRHEDMILRFAADLSAPFTNNEAERSRRPVKV